MAQVMFCDITVTLTTNIETVCEIPLWYFLDIAWECVRRMDNLKTQGLKWKWSKAHPEGGVSDREARWQQGDEQHIYLLLLCHSAAFFSSSTGTQSGQALRR